MTAPPADSLHRSPAERRSDLVSLLSDIAVRVGRKIRWDWEKETLLDDPGAERMLMRSYRAPWRL